VRCRSSSLRSLPPRVVGTVGDSDRIVWPTPGWAKASPDTVLVYHQRDDIKGCTCGWAKPGESHPQHQVAALHDAGWDVVPTGRIADLERKNANLGRLAAGGAPAGYALVRAEEMTDDRPPA
jgi:hypothetical protein